LEIVLVGLNHRTACLELREQLTGFLTRNGSALLETQKLPFVEECLFLNTCNRVEVLFTTGTPEQGTRDLIRIWAESLLKTPAELKGHLYSYRSDDAVRHLFRVAASLDSLVVGEPQILGQIKEAYREAVRLRTTGVVLNRLLHKTFSVAKRIRTETGIASHAVSISFAAVELAKKIFQDLTGKQVLVIGAGEMAELAVEHLLNNKVQKIMVANRTLERAMELARRWGGLAITLDEVPAALTGADIVLSSTGAPELIIHHAQVKAIMKQRRQRPLFFIDIAVPRDIDPGINALDNVYLYDIDDLQGVVAQNVAERKNEALQAERIVQEEAIKFRSWLNGLEVVPTIVRLRRKMEDIIQSEIKKSGAVFQELTEGQQKSLESMAQSILNKILHEPITFLKEPGHQGHQHERIDLIQKIFRLDKETDKDP
jgi:glutamyl-tRNA reductase